MRSCRRLLPYLRSNWVSARTTRFRCILLIYIQLLDLWRESQGSPYLAGRSMESCRWACKSLERPLERRASSSWPMLSSRPEGPPSEPFPQGLTRPCHQLQPSSRTWLERKVSFCAGRILSLRTNGKRGRKRDDGRQGN